MFHPRLPACTPFQGPETGGARGAKLTACKPEELGREAPIIYYREHQQQRRSVREDERGREEN